MELIISMVGTRRQICRAIVAVLTMGDTEYITDVKMTRLWLWKWHVEFTVSKK